jgi:transcriptional regulator with XRE-family HTH domain
MDHLKLLAIARLVGLTQTDIARHLDITPIQISRWAKGTRPLPPKHEGALCNLVCLAGEKFIESGKADIWPEGMPTLATLGGPTPLRQLLETLLDEIVQDYMERHGQGPSAQMLSALVALDALPRDEQELRKPANTAKLIELGRALMLAGQQLEQRTSIQTLLEGIYHANDARESDEPGSAGTANAVDQ